MNTPKDPSHQEVGQLPDHVHYADDRDRASSIDPDLLLVHPLLSSSVVRQLLPAFWPDGEMASLPAGYQEVPSPLFGLRAFCRHSGDCRFSEPDDDALEAARAWVDELSQRWDFGTVFSAGDVSFWAFLRDRLIRWVCEIGAQRTAMARMFAERDRVVLAVGLSDDQRMLLRELARQFGLRLRVVLAYVEPPAPVPEETMAERRMRKLFFLLQDAWHGVQFLFDDIFVRKPKVLLVSHTNCWRRRLAPGGRWGRTDVHLESVWRAARRQPLRPYYRSDSYHPDVGAMTSGILAPVHLRHFLFLLAQTSRGFRETRSILRTWNRLKQREGFVESLRFNDLDMSALLLHWLDKATRSALPKFVRDTRRESHFLRGIRPDVILLTHEQDANLPLLVAARRMNIPTVALQTQPLQRWDDAYLSAPPDRSHAICLPDSLCVYTPETKRRLVERGAFEPAQVVVTGDPRLEGAPEAGSRDDGERQRLRRLWGVDEDQKVIYLGCQSQELPEVLAWLASSGRGGRGIFLVLGLPGLLRGEMVAARQMAAANGLRWIHLIQQDALSESMAAVDLVMTSDSEQVAEALLHGVPSAWIRRPRGAASGSVPIPEELPTIQDGPSMDRLLRTLLETDTFATVSPAAREEFIERTYGARPGDASRRILDLIATVLSSRGQSA